MTKLEGRCRSPNGLRHLFICFQKILIDTESLLNPVIVLSATAVLIKAHGLKLTALFP